MPFNPHSLGQDHSLLVRVVIGNSNTIAIGDLVRTSIGGADAGYLERATASATALGICVGYTDSSGNPVPPAAYVAGSETATDVTTVTAAADNQTTFARWALVEASPFKRWTTAVNGTLGTTNTSPTSTNNRTGGYIDVDSVNSNFGRVLESSYILTRTAGTIRNFRVWGVDPLDTTRYVVSLACTELFVEHF